MHLFTKDIYFLIDILYMTTLLKKQTNKKKQPLMMTLKHWQTRVGGIF